MGVFLVYIFKSSVYLALFFLFFRMLLGQETFHRFNRWALLGILFLSFVLPGVDGWTVASQGLVGAMVQSEQPVFMGVLANDGAAAGSWLAMLAVVYLFGIVCFWAKHACALVQMLRLIRSGRREVMPDGTVLVLHKEEVAPFSWMHYIVVSEKDREENGRAILTHEQAHVRYRHSWDLMATDVCISLQWFNPAAWLLKQELQNVHEFEADEWVISQGIDAKTYQLLLIKKAVGTRLYSMANSFNHSSLKKRITMMIKKKSNPWARAKYLYVLPLAAIAVAAFARPEISSELNEISSVKFSDLSRILSTNSSEKLVSAEAEGNTAALSSLMSENRSAVNLPDQDPQKPKKQQAVDKPEVMPEYPGGYPELMKFISSNMKYPEEAFKKDIQGKVVVQFIVDKDGSLIEFNIVKKVDPLLDAEALRVLKTMPKWTPGKEDGKPVRVKMTIPVNFRLQ